MQGCRLSRYSGRLSAFVIGDYSTVQCFSRIRPRRPSTWHSRSTIAVERECCVVYDDKLDVTPQTTPHDVIVCIFKSLAEVTNNKRRRSTYRTVEANYRQTRSVARSLCNCWASCFTSCTHPLTQCHCSLLYTFYQACSHCVAKHSVMMQCIHIRLVEFCILQQYYSIINLLLAF